MDLKIFFVLVFLLFNISYSTTIKKRWISDTNEIRKFQTIILVCPIEHVINGWCFNGKIVNNYNSSMNRVEVMTDSRLHISVLYENDIVSCGSVEACDCGSIESFCNQTSYKFTFDHFLYYEMNEGYCNSSGIPRRETTVGGFKTVICDCAYGFYGEFCESKSKSIHWMLTFFWLIIFVVLSSLFLALLRRKFQRTYRPPNDKFRFVDVLNVDLRE